MLPDSPQFTLAELSRIIELERVLHPLARLQDYFKLINQAYFGPTHIDPDPETIAANLKAEIRSLRDGPVPPSQDIGSGRGFIRYQLHRGASDLEVEVLTQCLLDSRCADASALANWPALWRENWPKIAPNLLFTTQEADLISRCLAAGSLPSHSDLYREAYHPHYRVISGSLAHRLTAL